MAALATFVYVTDEHGQPFGFGPGDEVSDWAAEQIGAHCYMQDADGSDEPESKPTPRRGRPPKSSS